MTKPKPAADFLDAILRDASTAAARQPTMQILVELLGERDAAHCRPVSERGGRLVIEVDSAPLFAELHGFRREEVRLAMNERLKSRKFADVVFRLDSATA
ncbi:MAG: DUF721 domain-containing protein [Planctomycetota bacterium]